MCVSIHLTATPPVTMPHSGGPGLRWVLASLLHAIWSNADYLHFRRRSQWWELQAHINGTWEEMVPFPRKVLVPEALGQLVRCGLELSQPRDRLRAVWNWLRLGCQPCCAVELWLDDELVQLGVPWETVVCGSAWHGEILVKIHALGAAGQRALAILNRWCPGTQPS